MSLQAVLDHLRGLVRTLAYAVDHLADGEIVAGKRLNAKKLPDSPVLSQPRKRSLCCEHDAARPDLAAKAEPEQELGSPVPVFHRELADQFHRAVISGLALLVKGTFPGEDRGGAHEQLGAGVPHEAGAALMSLARGDCFSCHRSGAHLGLAGAGVELGHNKTPSGNQRSPIASARRRPRNKTITTHPKA